jgi:uncharacterized protein (UPF0548 family)
MSRAADYLAGLTDRRSFVHGDEDREMTARQERILVAGALDDREVFELLGSAERATWWGGRSLADPDFDSPAWGSRRRPRFNFNKGR